MSQNRVSAINSGLLSWIMLVAMIMCLSITGVAERKDGVSTSIYAVRSRVASGAKIKIIVSVANMSNSPVSVLPPEPGHAEEMVKLEVYNDNGIKLHRIDFHTVVINGKAITEPDDGVRVGSFPLLNPGQTWTAFALLGHLFNMSKPGTYTVKTNDQWMSIPEVPGGKQRMIDVKSNIVTITVMPKR